jgi:hypothetical protein
MATGLAVALVGGLLPAQAADLDERYEPGPRYGSAYEDPRYADLYGRPPAPPPSYGHPYPARPIPPAPIYRDHERYDPPYRRYSDAPRSYAHEACTPKDEIQHRLRSEGWNSFHEPRVIDRNTAFVNARRPSGRLFELKLDRCSGTILASRPLEPRRYYGPYTYYGPNTYGEYRPPYRPGWGRY